MGEIELIDDSELQPSDLPSQEASWDEIQRFALTFSGYGYVEALRPKSDPVGVCGNLAEAVSKALENHPGLPPDVALGDLRATLYWAQRWVRWATEDGVPPDELVAVCHRVIECIRLGLQQGFPERSLMDARRPTRSRVRRNARPDKGRTKSRRSRARSDHPVLPFEDHEDTP